MKGLTLTQREQTRLQVLNRVVEQQLTTCEATAILGLSERHAWRMLAAYRKEGAAALAHGNRGRRPRNAIPEETRRKVIALARTRYAGFNHTHLTEIMAEREGMVLSRSTVRKHPPERGAAQSAIPATAAPPAQASTDAPGGDAPPTRW